MKTLEKVYKVELTTDEIEIITTALHGEYKFCKGLRPDNQEESKRIYNKICAVREIRNSFASLVNRSYMGEDA